jgi:hypothetical protein
MDTSCAPALARTAAGPAVCAQDGIAKPKSAMAVSVHLVRRFMTLSSLWSRPRERARTDAD